MFRLGTNLANVSQMCDQTQIKIVKVKADGSSSYFVEIHMTNTEV